MQVTQTHSTIVRYCQDMSAGHIIVNKDYQRSSQVWPPRARSYLIETILYGYPMPKLSLDQRTDVKTRQTRSEIVDGQQRSMAILGFFQDELRLTGKSEFAGKRLSELDEEIQERFLSYELSIDVFVGATTDEIREVFRRINSYNIPLNPQEQRHSEFQGEFKWFMVELSSKYDQLLKDLGVFSEIQLNRMQDAVMLTEVIMAIYDGISSSSESKISAFYKEHDAGGTFPDANKVSSRIEMAFNQIIDWNELRNTQLMKAYNIYSLLLAIMHVTDPIYALQTFFGLDEGTDMKRDIVVTNLSTLAAALDEPNRYGRFDDFVIACSGATNRVGSRRTRFQYFCRALQPQLL